MFCRVHQRPTLRLGRLVAPVLVLCAVAVAAPPASAATSGMGFTGQLVFQGGPGDASTADLWSAAPPDGTAVDSGVGGYVRAIAPSGDEFVGTDMTDGTEHLYGLPDGADIGDAATDAFLANDQVVNFSPDGTRILAINTNTGDFETFDTVTDATATLPGCMGPDPQWQSDDVVVCGGQETSDSSGVDSPLLLVDVSTGAVTQFYDVAGAAAGVTPMTGADGSPIFWDVESMADGSEQLWTAAADGSDPHAIGSSGAAGLTSVSRDGSHLLETLNQYDVTDGYGVYDVASGTMTDLPSDQWSGYAGGISGQSSAWSPDGQYLVMVPSSGQGAPVIDDLTGQVAYTVPTPPGADSSFAWNGLTVAWTDSPCMSDTDVSDGAWDFGGCFTQPDSTDYHGTKDATLDGLVLSPQGGDTLDFSDGGSSGQTVSDSGPVNLEFDTTNITAEMPAGATAKVRSAAVMAAATKHKVLLASLQSLQWALSGSPVMVTADESVTLAGLPLIGQVQLTPGSAGSVMGTATTTLPGVLGGKTASMQVTSVHGSGVTGMKVSAPTANLAGLLPLRNVKLAWAQGKWQLSATAVPPGSSGAAVSGQLTYNQANTLTSANLSVSNVPLAGMVTLSSLKLQYTIGTGWTGSATLKHAKSTAGIKLEFNSAGQLTGGYLHAANVQMFGVLDLAKFDLDVTSPDTWKLSVEPAAIKHKGTPTTVAATLGMANGAVTGASLDIHNVAFLSKLTLDNLNLAYKAAGNTYDGKIAVTLPGPAGAVVSGKSEFHFANTRFSSGSIEVSGLNAPIGWGAVLHTIGADVKMSPLSIGGKVGISFGPKTPAGAALDTIGHLAYNFATHTYSGNGSVSLANITLGNGTFTLDAAKSTASVTVNLGNGDGSEGLSVGKLATLHGTIHGQASAKSMRLDGSADFTIAGHKVGDATVHADKAGMAACTSSGNGFTWRWGSNPQPHFDGTCSLKGY